MTRTGRMLLDVTGTQRNEADRRNALLQYAILDSLPDRALDEIAELAAQLCQAQYAYIGFLDDHRIWFKSCIGFNLRELPRASSAMEFTLFESRISRPHGKQDGKENKENRGDNLENRVELIADAAADRRFPPGGIPLGPEIGCRSSASAPLLAGRDQGHKEHSQDRNTGVGIGTLTVLSSAPEAFTQEHCRILEMLARQVMTRLELYSREGKQEQVIRARQRIERALMVERNFVSAVLETMSAPVLVLDTAGRIVRFNQACERISGYKFSELAGRPFPEQLFLPEERKQAIEIFDQARAGTLRGNYELHWQPREGRRRRICWTATTLADASGEVNFIVTSGVDVTEQREAALAQGEAELAQRGAEIARREAERAQLEAGRAEQEAGQALRSSEMRYRLLVEGSLGFVWTQALDGRLLSINAHGAEALGYSMNELLGKPIAEFMAPQHAFAFNFRRQQWVDQRTEPQSEQRHPGGEQKEEQGVMHLIHRDGGTRVVAYSNRLLQLPDAEAFFLGHGIDITDQTAAEEKLHMLMRQRESILDSVGDGICGMDMDGQLTFVNHGGARLLGYEVGELLGQDMHALLHHHRADGSLYPKEECPISKSLNALTPIRVSDEVYWRKDGSSFPVEYVACPLVDEGRTTGTVVAFQDVTERRQLDRMKDEFISTVSHELRTPLTSLRAALGLISSGLLEKHPEKTSQMLQMAITNCERLEGLVNDILDFERIGSGGFVLNAAEHNVIDLLRRAVEQQRLSAAKAGLRFRIDAEPVNVRVDGERILQVLSNLIGNAIKFAHAGGEIRLCAYGSSEDEVTMEVCDQGRGIPPEKLEMIFERFQQLDASDSRASGGTGLGLAICKSIVGQHGGSIWAESTPGKGSTFFFTLPRHSAGE